MLLKVSALTSIRWLRYLCTAVLVIITITTIDFAINHRRLERSVTHFLRPLFQTRAAANVPVMVQHQLSSVDTDTCALYQVAPRVTPVRVFELFLFDNEFDLLDIKLHELADHVDQFILVESGITFTGKSKPTHFANNKEKYAQFTKLHAITIPSDKMLAVTGGAWGREAYSRLVMMQAIVQLGIQEGDIVIQTDVDEILRANTVQLLKKCNFHESQFPMNLMLRDYRYSFEFLDPNLWSLSVHAQVYSKKLTKLVRAPPAITRLADAGWHCSWCFPQISDFVHKITSYSHTEHNQPRFLDKNRIQQYVCEGKELFDRWGECYSFRELVNNWDGTGIRQYSAIDIPSLVSEQPHRFDYLLPGHCWRVEKKSFTPPVRISSP